MGKNKYIETPEKLLEFWNLYKADVKNNPRFKYILSQKTGEMVAEPLERPLTQVGFEAYCYRKFGVTICHYFDNPLGAYDDYRTICTHIVNERKDDQIDGGMVGQYNSSITQRLNGLTEKTESVVTTSISVLNLDPLDDSKDNLLT